MSKTSTNKTPKTVEIKLLIPYAIIAILIVAIAGLITGWFVHNNYTQSMQQEYNNGVASVKTSQK
jgi:hypothetical protein